MDEGAFKQSPLFGACIIKDADLALRMAKVLQEAGVKPDKQDTLQQIPLYYAVREGHLPLIKYLLEHGS